MWYVIQVFTGTEEKTAESCRRVIGVQDKDAEDAFQDAKSVLQGTDGAFQETDNFFQETDGILQNTDTILQKCFIPYVIRKRRYYGEWHEEKKILFPGYVFLVSDNPGELFLRLKKVPGLTKLLGTGDEIVPLSAEEEELLKKLGGEDHVVEGSIGILEQDKIVITEGPLQGMEGYIRKIDRHKRTAWLEVELMGRMIETQVGLEIVEKRVT